MEFKEVQPEVETILEHEHLLIPDDLQSMYQNYVEDDDDFDDLELIEMQKFKCTCEICGLGIDWYHRHYYKCSESSCSYTCHKFCGDMPKTIQFPAHPNHTLHLKKMSNSWSCHACLTKHRDGGVGYQCCTCPYEIDLRCVTFAERTVIHHPGHSHPLIPITNDPTLSKCYSCGKEHKGVFYHCFTCFNFSIHNDCVNLPFKLTLAYHVHKLTLSYSFTIIPYYSKCRICQKSISETVWLYKCSKCRYYVHIDCAASSSKPFMFLSRGGSDANFKAADYPDLVHYPLLDESYNMLPRHIQRGNFQGFDEIIFENDIPKHPSHQHPLLLIKSPNYTAATHDPDKRIKLVCNGCVRPITTTPFYECREEESSCNFYLHEWCTRLPLKIENHPGHPNHRLVLFHSPPHKLNYTGFQCNVCGLCCNGFGYACSLCSYGLDVHCAFIPKNITHEAHPSHLLTRVDAPTSTKNSCSACGVIINANELCFNCNTCEFYLDNRCALHLPKTIRHKYDSHPLRLSYSPIENHKGEYFCEVCEEELIPEKWFYHCQASCGQSIHSACAPLILQSEQDVNSVHNREGVCHFLNMKFEGIVHFRDHEHVLLILVGTESDGDCCVCRGELRSFAMFKCSQCEDAFHVKCGMSWYGIKIRGMSSFTNIARPKPKEVKKHLSAITFYPCEVTRPIPWQPKDIDGQS